MKHNGGKDRKHETEGDLLAGVVTVLPHPPSRACIGRPRSIRVESVEHGDEVRVDDVGGGDQGRSSGCNPPSQPNTGSHGGEKLESTGQCRQGPPQRAVN